MLGGLRRYGESLLSLRPWGSEAEDGADQSRGSRSSSRSALASLQYGVSAASFWMAITLPFLYVPIFVTGLDERAEYVAFGGLIVAHVLFLSLGHSYASDPSRSDGSASRSPDSASDTGEHTPGD